MASATVTLSGPFFAADADAKVEVEVDKVRAVIADAAYDRVMALTHDFFRYAFPFPPGYTPGYYRSRIAIDRKVSDVDRIHDSRVVYGPWLEGIGSRNRTTRFKGYHSFRLVAQGMQQRAVDLGVLEARRIVEVLS